MSKPTYGGQAVMEGVMMAGPKGKAIAVRLPNGDLTYKIEEKSNLAEKYPILKWPLIRGCYSFCKSFVSGISDLTWSAAQAGESEEEKLTTKELVLAVVTALFFTILVFVIIPVAAGTWLYPYLGDFGRSLFEGVLRLGLFLGYVVIISRLKDIQRIFAYHGAEHKTINAYEAGVKLTPENVRNYSRIHTRCGTSFLLMAMIVMIVLFTFIGQTDALHRSLIKIVMLPVVAGLSYELFRLPLRFPNSKIVRILVAPGLATQRLTTREPELDQIAVAIAALTHVPGFVPNGEATAETATFSAEPPQAAEETTLTAKEETEAPPQTEQADTTEIPAVIEETAGQENAAVEIPPVSNQTETEEAKPLSEAEQKKQAAKAKYEKRKSRIQGQKGKHRNHKKKK